MIIARPIVYGTNVIELVIQLTTNSHIGAIDSLLLYVSNQINNNASIANMHPVMRYIHSFNIQKCTIPLKRQ